MDSNGFMNLTAQYASTQKLHSQHSSLWRIETLKRVVAAFGIQLKKNGPVGVESRSAGKYWLSSASLRMGARFLGWLTLIERFEAPAAELAEEVAWPSLPPLGQRIQGHPRKNLGNKHSLLPASLCVGPRLLAQEP